MGSRGSGILICIISNRATARLGRELVAAQQDGRRPFGPRCIKDVLDERLSVARRDLLRRPDLGSSGRDRCLFRGCWRSDVGSTPIQQGSST